MMAKERISAFHGSPHKFEKFDLKKIGSGEGAQAYGHGMYFAENRKVAEEYKKALATEILVDNKPFLRNNRRLGTTGDNYVDDLILAHNGDLESAIADMRQVADESKRKGYPDRLGARTIPQLEALRGRVDVKNTGHIYEVGIDAHPDHFLDWDRPIKDQHETVRQALRNLWVQRGGALENRTNEPFTSHPDATGEDAHAAMVTTFGGNEPVAKALQSQGVPGIKYLDQGSRTQGYGSLNYVVFDPDRVTIHKREPSPDLMEDEIAAQA